MAADGISETQPKPARQPKSSEAEILKIVEQHAKEKKIDLSRYGPLHVSVDRTEKKLVWFFFYFPPKDAKYVIAGDHCSFSIDDETHKVSFMGGM